MSSHVSQHMKDDSFLAPGPWKFSQTLFEDEAEQLTFKNLESLELLDLSIHQNTLDGTKALKLPDLESFTYGALDGVPSSASSQLLTDITYKHEDDYQDEIWASLSFDQFNEPKHRARNWEQFYDKEFKEKQIYLSEASPTIWNALWSQISNENESQRQAENGSRTNIFGRELVMAGLFQLGLGFQSALFKFTEQDVCARAEISSSSGLSSELTADLIKEFGAVGQHFRFLDEFVRESYRTSNTCSSTVAAAAAIEQVTSTVKRFLVQIRSKPKTLLQLQDTFCRPCLILVRLSSLVKSLRPHRRNVDVFDQTYRFADSFESVDPWFRPIALHILQRVADPCLQTLSGYLALYSGLNADVNFQKELNQIEQADHDDPVGLGTLEKALPSLLDPKQKKNVIETVQSLSLIKNYDKDNVLIKEGAGHFDSTRALAIVFGWEDIERIQRKATEYERNIRSLLAEDVPCVQKRPATAAPLEQTMSLFGLEEDQIAENFFRSYSLLDDVSAEGLGACDGLLQDAVVTALLVNHDKEEHSDFLPPLSLASSASISPILSAQSRLVNQACLKMLFHGHDLVHHLQLQYQFQLLGSGVFTSRLRQALFSPNLSSAERRKGHSRSGVMGLRLGSRQNWPPASAELRLVLMGILSDCYRSTFPANNLHAGSSDLPGHLSFSLRNLSEPEIEACLNPSSLQALDFLRLQYRPPPPLGAIITETTLDKYDRIFRFLMRISRVSFAVTNFSDLLGSARVNILLTRFRNEACHFVNCLSLYVHSCISSSWTRFSRIIQSLEQNVQSDDLDQLGSSDGLYQLAQLHHAMLDHTLFELLLRNRQEKVMEVLEDILRHVLEFTQVSKMLAQQEPDVFFEEVAILFSKFREKVMLFIAVCKGLGEKGAYKIGKTNSLDSTAFARDWKASETQSEGIESLVVMLDMNGWYQKQSAAYTFS